MQTPTTKDVNDAERIAIMAKVAYSRSSAPGVREAWIQALAEYEQIRKTYEANSGRAWHPQRRL